MPLAKYEPKPGFQSQATQLQAEGAWFAGNRIRWRNGLLEKMGGWMRLFQPSINAAVRRMHAWQDLQNLRHLAVGNDNGIVIELDSGPFVYAQPLGEPQQNTWYLANLGQTGLALKTNGQLQAYTPPPISPPYYNPVLSNTGSAPPYTVPQKSAGMCTAMPQAQVIVWGTESVNGSGNTDPLQLRWSDAGTYGATNSTDWTATVSNMAGQYRISRGSKIVRILQAPQTMLILTDTDLWTMSYIGPPLVYGFTAIASGCGLIAPHAFATLGNATFWLSRKNVWAFGPGGAQIVPCSVWDYLFENLDTINEFKCHGAANSTTGEVAFYFPYKGDVFPPGKNPLSYSQDFTNAIWTKTGVTAAATGTVSAPDSTATTQLLTETAVTSAHEVVETVNKFNEPMVFTLSVYAHKNTTRNIVLKAEVGRGPIGCSAVFNPTTGALVPSGLTVGAPFTNVSAQSTVDSFATGLSGNGWLRYILTFTTDDATVLNSHIGLASGTSLSYLGVVSQVGYFWGAQLNAGGQALPYSITTTVVENECTRYIKFNTIEGAWDSGILPRRAWLDSSNWGTPLGADDNNYIQQHERGYDADGAPMTGVYAEAAYTQIGDGTQMMSISQVHPDFKWLGNGGEVQLRFKGKGYSGASDNLYGPFSMTPTTKWFDPRLRARMIAVRYDWSPIMGFSARVGAVHFRVKPTGKGP